MKHKIWKIIYPFIFFALVYIFINPEKQDRLLPVLLFIVTIISVLISHMVYLSQSSPSLYAIANEQEGSGIFTFTVMDDFIVSQNVNIHGLAIHEKDSSIELKIVNNGNYPATNIEVEYSIITYHNKITFGEDQADIVSYKPVKLEKVDKTLKFDYIPPNGAREETIFITSKYPQADIQINKLKCSEGSFVHRNTNIYRYQDDRFEYLSDNQDLLCLLGIYDPWDIGE